MGGGGGDGGGGGGTEAGGAPPHPPPTPPTPPITPAPRHTTPGSGRRHSRGKRLRGNRQHLAGQVYRPGRRRTSRERVGGREWGGRRWSQSRALALIAGARGGGATGSAIRTCWRAAAWRPGRVSPHAGSGRRPAAAGAAATTPADASTRASLPASACSSTATVAAQRLGRRVRKMGRGRGEHPAGERSRSSAVERTRGGASQLRPPNHVGTPITVHIQSSCCSRPIRICSYRIVECSLLLITANSRDRHQRNVILN